MRASGAAAASRECRHCRHFRDAPDYLERILPGLSALSSGHAAVRGQDGICEHHARFTTAGACCDAFTAGKWR